MKKERTEEKFRFPVFTSNKLMSAELEVLELSVRSSNCLHRAGIMSVGDLVEQIQSSDDLKKIRNCGQKSVNEIMTRLLEYQYSILSDTQRIRFSRRIKELNGGLFA